jgi:saccharopine dehydrogenase-like NADP-dependent oxidoreductase
MKKLICLGGAGRICSESVRDLAKFTDEKVFTKITIADYNIDAAKKLASEINDPRVIAVKVDVNDREKTLNLLKGYDLVLDATTIQLNGKTADCISNAGCSGINLNGFGDELAFNDVFVKNNAMFVPGFGAGPGVTEMMIKNAADRMEKVEIVRCSHGAYRPIAYSPSIFETTAYEYVPVLETREIFENGKFVKMPPFARERMIKLPEPFGENPQWLIPHNETRSASAYLKNKGIKLVECRGTWPPKNMRLMKALVEWGFTRNDNFSYKGTEMGIIDAIGSYLQQSKEGTTTELYGYALHVQVVGWINGVRTEIIQTSTHPTSDGSVPEWEGVRSYCKNVGLPAGIAIYLMAIGKAKGTGVVVTQAAFEPQDVFNELKKRKIFVHETVNENYDKDLEYCDSELVNA